MPPRSALGRRCWPEKLIAASEFMVQGAQVHIQSMNHTGTPPPRPSRHRACQTETHRIMDRRGHRGVGWEIKPESKEMLNKRWTHGKKDTGLSSPPEEAPLAKSEAVWAPK